MKTILISILLACTLAVGACSRSDKQPETAQTIPPQSLKSDAERLQQATTKAAEARKRAEQARTSTPSVSPP